MSFATTVVGTATWQQTSFPQVTSVGGVYATSPTTVYVAYSDNTKGPGVAVSVDGGNQFSYELGGELNTDTARDKHGNEVITTVGGIFVSHSDESYELLAGKDITFSQNVETFGETSFGVTGTHYPQGVFGPVVNGVAVSNDGGVTFSYFDIGTDWSTYVARYSAFPSATTWYVAQGTWGSTTAKAMRNPANITKAWEYNAQLRQSSHAGGLTYGSNTKADFVVGAISKTTDGGKTFHEVYNTKGKYYFNEIDCSSTEICMAVAEDSFNAIVLRTEDGGKTWVEKLSLSDPKMASLAGCKMLSDSEAWVSGGTFNGGLIGWFYHTLDGGNSWEPLQTLPKGYSLDLSFSGSTGYSPAMSEFGSTLAILK